MVRRRGRWVETLGRNFAMNHRIWWLPVFCAAFAEFAAVASRAALASLVSGVDGGLCFRSSARTASVRALISLAIFGSVCDGV